ncbi:MAG: DUF805 domain-containing protein [Proteobacteria bacterium]|nr:DUF805 domain-containing protein [Pseudomonadota bacterium]
MSDQIQKLADGPKRKWLDGRGGRKEFWLLGVPLVIVGSVIAAIVGSGWGAVAQFAFGIAFLLFMIRRLHDIGVSGWIAPLINVASTVLLYAAKGFLPPAAYGLAALVILLAILLGLGAWPGTAGDNAYGPPPGRRKSSPIAEVFS